MKRISVGLLATVLALGLIGGPAVAKRDRASRRVVVERYLWPNGVRTTHYQDGLELLPEPPGLLFHPEPGERYVMFEFDDDVGDFVYVHLYQEGSRGRADLDRPFCGPRGAFPLVGGGPIELRFYSGLCENHLVGIATQGTVRATFSTRSYARLSREHEHAHSHAE